MIGDVLTKGDVLQLQSQAPHATIVNLYGTTETQRAAGYFMIPPHSPLPEKIPLGTGIRDVQLLVLNKSQNLAGIGERGEIYVRSPHMGKGYLHDEELTNKNFLANPFTQTAGDYLYKTGDLGRYFPNGAVEFLGRADYQVKIRGFRVELGEVETAIRQHPSIRQVVVLTKKDESDEKQLVAYLRLKQGTPRPSLSEIRKFLEDKLLSPTIPSSFVILDIFPITPNGKIDRGAFPSPNQSSLTLDTTFVEPRNHFEEVTIQIWKEVLGNHHIGIHDNFFELGGNSLDAMRVLNRIRSNFGIEIPLRAIFETPTVEQIALQIKNTTMIKGQI